MWKTCFALAVILAGCSSFHVVPSTQPLSLEQRFDQAQQDLTTQYDALVLAHSLGAFHNPKQWEMILSYEAAAQVLLNVTKSSISNDPKSFDELLKAANAAVLRFKQQSKE